MSGGAPHVHGEYQHMLDHEAQSGAQLPHPHHRLAQSMMLVQIAISLASITVLTRRRWLLWVGGVAAVGGLSLTVMAFLGAGH